jgi:AbrB family looped-hinge helix DNA binding protein
MAEATLSSKNQIVIPGEAREALGVKPGDNYWWWRAAIS